MNPLHERLVTGTIGELLVQLRLLQYDVQAAPPLKDSGNDLIAVRRQTLKTIQVKTTSIDNGRLQIPRNRLYHILALVRLCGEGTDLRLDESEIYLIDRQLIEGGNVDLNNLEPYRISLGLVDSLFPPQN